MPLIYKKKYFLCFTKQPYWSWFYIWYSTYSTSRYHHSALYPKAMVTWIKNNQKHMKPHAFISDVSGVKSGIVEEIQNFFARWFTFLCKPPDGWKRSKWCSKCRWYNISQCKFYHNSNSQKHASKIFPV